MEFLFNWHNNVKIFIFLIYTWVNFVVNVYLTKHIIENKMDIFPQSANLLKDDKVLLHLVP